MSIKKVGKAAVKFHKELHKVNPKNLHNFTENRVKKAEKPKKGCK